MVVHFLDATAIRCKNVPQHQGAKVQKYTAVPICEGAGAAKLYNLKMEIVR